MAKDKNDEISNFIDFNEKVFLLNNENISHDVPFTNEYSGVIPIDIVAKSSIFIRNHYVQEDEPYSYKGLNKELISKKFCHYKGVPYIPSTSMKGMLRNVLEIISYGKLKGKTLDNYLDEKTEESSNHQSEILDLSEAIFGTTELKGRVQFSHFKVEGRYNEDSEKKEILMTPEAKKKKFGWKKYPILNGTISSKKGNNDDVVSHFIPLQKNVKFKGQLRFHNLRDFELGAVLSSLSFHKTEQCFHNIGMAKSLGYGKISIEFKYDKLVEVLEAFEERMNIELFDAKVLWHKSFYIQELLKKQGNANVNEFKALSNLEKLKTKKKEDKKKEKELKTKKYNKVLEKQDLLVPSKKQLKKAIESYFKKIIKPYFEMKHLDEFLDKNFQYTPIDIQECYRKMENENRELMVDLLLRRKLGKITNQEMSVLYNILLQN